MVVFMSYEREIVDKKDIINSLFLSNLKNVNNSFFVSRESTNDCIFDLMYLLLILHGKGLYRKLL